MKKIFLTMVVLVLACSLFAESNSTSEAMVTSDITYQVDLNEITDLYDGGAVWVAFGAWDSYNEMADADADGIYSVTIQQESGTDLQYFFSYQTGADPNSDYTEETIPAECADGDGYRTLTVPETALTLPAVLYGSCDEMPVHAATTVWNPAANPEGTGMWTEDANWTDGLSPLNNKVVFNVPDARECVLDVESTISRLVVGDNGPGGTLRLKDGANLVISADDWSSVGWTHEATMIVEEGATATFGHHMWIGFNSGSNGTVILNGGTINVSMMTGIGWNGGVGSVYVNSGVLNCAQLNPNQSIGDGSVIDIAEGTVNFTGNFYDVVQAFEDSSKIIAYGGTGDVVIDTVGGVTIVTAVPPQQQATTVWNPAANPSGTGLWTEALNWTDGNVPDSNKVVFNVEGARECVLDAESYIKQLVAGDNGPGGTLRIADGGNLTMSNEVWSGIGWNNTAELIVETGGTVTFGQHMWVGFNSGADGTAIINGGTINVDGMFGINFEGLGGEGSVYVNSGVLNLAQLHPQNSLRGAGALLDVSEGTVNIVGDHVSVIEAYVDSARITAYGGRGEVLVAYDTTAAKTIVTANALENAETTVWNPAGNPNTTGLWREAANWTDGVVPDSNKVVFNVEGAQECVLDVESNIRQLVAGDNGPGGTLRIVEDGNLNISNEIWSGIGWNNTAELIVETGGTVTFGQHMWVGFNSGANGTAIINGGTINVDGMFGINFEGLGGEGSVYVNSGVLNLAQIHPENSLRGDGALLDISEGTVNIVGDKVSIIEAYVASEKITGYSGAGEIVVVVEGGNTVITSLPPPPDITDLDGFYFRGSGDDLPFSIPNGGGSPDGERLKYLFDNDVNTKYLISTATSWLDVYTNRLSNVKSYTITSANDAPTRDPKDWEFQGWDTENNAWVTIHTVTGNPSWPDFFTPKTWFIENDGWYSSYRLNITAINDDPQELMQISEFEIFAELGDTVEVITPVGPIADITNLDVFTFKGSGDDLPFSIPGGGGSPEGERLMYLFDNDVTTKYLVSSIVSWMELYTNKLSQVKAYTITSANDAPTRDPKDWNLQGWNAETSTWESIDTVMNNPSWPDFFTPKTWDVDGAGWYSTYRLDITAINDDPQELMQISELDIFGIIGEEVEVVYPTSIEDNVQNPMTFSLSQNYPNPFNPTTNIKYSIPNMENVKLSIYNMIGQEVMTLVNTKQDAGFYHVTFDASRLSSGIYFYSLRAGNYSKTHKMVLLK